MNFDECVREREGERKRGRERESREGVFSWFRSLGCELFKNGTKGKY